LTVGLAAVSMVMVAPFGVARAEAVGVECKAKTLI
jgi:hypothetical protein